MSIFRRLAWTALVVAISLAAPAARAEPSADASARAAARDKLVDGVALLKRGDYSGALTEFQDAYRLVPSPNIHYDLGLAYVGLGRAADALEAFERFLAEAPEAPAATRQKAEANAQLMRGRVAVVTVAVDEAGAEVLLDGHVRGLSPLPRPLPLEVGRHELAARKPGGAAGPGQAIDARAGTSAAVSLHLPGVAAAAGSGGVAAVVPSLAPPAPGATAPLEPPDTTSPGTARARWWAASSAGLGVALLGTGLTFALLARSEGDSLTELSRQSTEANRPEFPVATESHGRAYDKVALVAVSAGVVALTTGAIILLLSNRRAAPGSRAGADLSLRF